MLGMIGVDGRAEVFKITSRRILADRLRPRHGRLGALAGLRNAPSHIIPAGPPLDLRERFLAPPFGDAIEPFDELVITA